MKCPRCNHDDVYQNHCSGHNKMGMKNKDCSLLGCHIAAYCKRCDYQFIKSCEQTGHKSEVFRRAA